MEKLKCKYFNHCGGCSLLNVEYSEQLKKKRKLLINALEEHSVLCDVDECEGMYYPYKYRNKVHFAIEQNGKNVKVGFYEEKTNSVVDIDECLLFDNWAIVVLNILRKYLKSFKLTGYDKIENAGLLRYAVARYVNNQLMIVLVATSQNFPGKEYFYNDLKNAFKNVSLYLNINNRTDNAVFDDAKFFHKYGAEKLSCNIMGVKYEIMPNSFLQVNEKIMQKMYSKAIELMDLSEEDSVIDLYSGIGITSILFAKKCKDVYSIELSKSAVMNARANISINKMQAKIKSFCGSCAERINDIPLLKNCKVFMDPARSGCEPETLKSIISIKPKIVIYMSCNPETLSRDLDMLTKTYNIVYIKPYDMFPQTDHVETLVCLKLK